MARHYEPQLKYTSVKKKKVKLYIFNNICKAAQTAYIPRFMNHIVQYLTSCTLIPIKCFC